MPDLILGESLEVLIDHRGKTPRKLGGDFVRQGVPVASALLVKDGRLALGEARCVTEEMYGRWMSVSLKRHDVLLTSEAPLGRVALVPDDSPLVLGQRLFGLRGKAGVLDSRFLFYALQTDAVQSELRGRATGTTVAGIRQSELVRVRIPAPSYPEQVAIAAVLGALDEKIAVNDRIVENSYELVQAQWTKSALGARNFVPVSQLAEVNKGLSYKGSGLGGSVPLVNLGNFSTDGRFKGSALKYYDGESKDRHWVSRGGLLMANTDLTQRREILGQPALAMTDAERALFTHHVFAIRPHAGVEGDLLWLYGAFRDPLFRERAITYATGTTVVALPRDAVLTYEVPWPGQKIRRDWSDKAQALIDDTAARSGENRTLSHLRDALLPGLMSGGIRVRDAESAVEDAT